MLDIHEVAQTCGLPASALRYYEEQGLISSVGRRGLRRLFAPEVLQRLALIALGQTAGFSLSEIAQMLAAPGGPQIDKAQLAQKAEELEGRIRELTALRNALRHVMDCPAPDQFACPTFQRILRAGLRKHRAGRVSAQKNRQAKARQL